MSEAVLVVILRFFADPTGRLWCRIGDARSGASATIAPAEELLSLVRTYVPDRAPLAAPPHP